MADPSKVHERVLRNVPTVGHGESVAVQQHGQPDDLGIQIFRCERRLARLAVTI